ncbi:hypothetical protein JCM9279_003712 [Rhodotorula babjevae]
MATPPQAVAPPSDLHTHSLSFPLDALDTLSSTQLALVQFHPQAADTQTARARALFVHRRMAWLEQEMVRARAREQVADAAAAAARREVDRSRTPLARVKEGQDEGLVELQPEAGSSTSMPASSSPPVDETPSGSVKREGGEEEREVRPRQLEGPRLSARVLSPSATPTPAPTLTAASAPTRAVDHPARPTTTSTSTTVDPRRRPRPPAPQPAPAPAAIVKHEVEVISLLDDDDDDEPEDRPFALPRAKAPRPSSDAQVISPSSSPRLSPSTKRSSDAVVAAGGSRPSKAPRRALSAASPPLPPTADRLKAMPSFRRKGQASPPTIELPTRGAGLVPTPTPTPPPAPATFVPKPNPLATTAASSALAPVFPAPAPSSSRTTVPRGIQAALRAGRAPSQNDWEFEHWLQPPSPFPTFVALGAPAVDKGAVDPIAPAFARRLYTVRVHGLSDECTAAAVFWFMMRNEGRLRPRPLAIRSTDEPAPYLDGLYQPRQPVFFFAFGSLEAAELISKDNDQRLLPDMEDPRQISIELVRDAVPANATWEARRASEAKELAVDWRWGELSDEARWYWTRRADLPPSPVCPRFEDVEVEGRPLSDEYSAEVDRIVADATGEPLPSTRDKLMTRKKDLYNSRRNKWRAWLALGPAQQAALPRPRPAPDSMPATNADTIAYLRSLPSIRERCGRVFALAEAGKLDYWTLDLAQQDKIVEFVCGLIARDFGDDYASIPPHGRWRHFVGGRVDPLLSSWDDAAVDPLEKARRLVDLMVTSVLLDAGAGNDWKFAPKDGGDKIGRSEGLAVGSLEMFEAGMFSGDESQLCRVDAVGLSKITPEEIAKALQVSDSNPMTGIDGRAQLLVRLGSVLSDPSNAAYFTQNGSSRPGHLVDYLLSHPTSQAVPSAVLGNKVAVQMDTLWDIIISGLSGVWPAARSKIDGVSLGDVWPVECLAKQDGAEEFGDLVSFHKLSQWLTYSLIEVMETLLAWQFIGKEQMTGLPEYRNGGLLIDFDLLVPNIPAMLTSFSLPVPSSPSSYPTLLELPPFDASHSAMVEMRAVTICMLDRIRSGINARLGVELSLPQVLESSTWKGGREIAKKLRPETAGPPFRYVATGDVF